MAKLIETRQVERDYGTNGTDAIVGAESGQRFLIQDAFGGIGTLAGGAVGLGNGVFYV